MLVKQLTENKNGIKRKDAIPTLFLQDFVNNVDITYTSCS